MVCAGSDCPLLSLLPPCLLPLLFPYLDPASLARLEECCSQLRAAVQDSREWGRRVRGAGLPGGGRDIADHKQILLKHLARWDTLHF